MSARTVAVSAALIVGLLVPVAGASAAKAPPIAKQLKALTKQVKKNTATGKANTAKIKAASKAVATTVAGLNAKADAINKRVDAGDKATSDLDGKVNTVITTATDALTKLQAGLVQVADGLKALAASYGNFEYGVVQLNTLNGATATPIAGAFLATPRLDPNVSRLQEELAEKLGAKVAIQHGAGGKGKLVVTYNSLDELDGILAHIQ